MTIIEIQYSTSNLYQTCFGTPKDAATQKEKKLSLESDITNNAYLLEQRMHTSKLCDLVTSVLQGVTDASRECGDLGHVCC